MSVLREPWRSRSDRRRRDGRELGTDRTFSSANPRHPTFEKFKGKDSGKSRRQRLRNPSSSHLHAREPPCQKRTVKILPSNFPQQRLVQKRCTSQTTLSKPHEVVHPERWCGSSYSDTLGIPALMIRAGSQARECGPATGVVSRHKDFSTWAPTQISTWNNWGKKFNWPLTKHPFNDARYYSFHND